MLTLKQPAKLARGLAFSPDGAELAVAGGSRDDAPAGLAVGPADGSAAFRRLLPEDRVWAVSYAPDGRLVAAVGDPADESACTGFAAVLAAGVEADRLAVGGRAVAWGDCVLGTAVRRAGGYAEWHVCRRLNGEPVWEHPSPGNADGLAAWTPDGRALTLLRHRPDPTRATYYELKVSVRDGDTGEELASGSVPGRGADKLLADGERLGLLAGPNLYLWRLADLSAVPTKVAFGRQSFTDAVFLPAGHLLAGRSDGSVHCLDPATGAAVTSYTLGGKPLCLAVAPDGLRAAVGTDRGTVVLFDLD